MEQHNKFNEAIAENGAEKMCPRQDPLMALYQREPGEAQIVDHAVTRSTVSPADVALYTEVIPSKGAAYPIGVHKAVGGLNDFATPGDLLCAAIASCLDSTIRIIANRLGVQLKSLEVAVSGHVDVRGTLRVDDATPVGFHKLEIDAKIEPVADMPDAYLDAILKGAEQSCVVLQTIKAAPKISLTRVRAEPAEQISAA